MVPCLLGRDELSDSLVWEMVERVWRSGDDLVGEWSRYRLLGGDLGDCRYGLPKCEAIVVIVVAMTSAVYDEVRGKARRRVRASAITTSLSIS
jgi:hypothetical protein